MHSIELEDGESRYLRDSLGYLIDQHGYIYFSTENPNEEYFIRAVSSSLDLYGMALPGLHNISVPAGEFDCSAEVIYVKYNENGELLPSMSEQFYKEGVGEILTQYSVITDSFHRYEKRLLNYELGN
ncbi:MAG: hypothetical protein DWP94_14505 [Flavobacterium sp.]|nr:MAG: hypothetical protein DWP94_14505 [Flavobacterium sp.]